VPAGAAPLRRTPFWADAHAGRRIEPMTIASAIRRQIVARGRFIALSSQKAL
jgi:hypothetical protein